MVSGYIYNHDYKITCESHLRKLQQAHTGLKNFCNDLEYVSFSILSDGKTQSFIKESINPNTSIGQKQRLTMNYSLFSLMDSRKFISTITMFNSSDILFQNGDRKEVLDLRYIEKAAVLKGKPFWTPAYLRRSRYNGIEYQDTVVSLVRVINDLYQFERQIAIERITVRENYICSLYSAMNTDSSRMYVVSAEGSVISATDKEMLNENFAQDEKLAWFFSKNTGILERDNKVYFFSTQAYPNWTLVMVEERDVLLSNAKIIMLVGLINIVLIVIFGIVFILAQNRNIIKPVLQLSKEASSFREGNLIIHRISTSSDEIGQLNRSLERMSVYIRNLVEQEYKSKLSQREMELEYLQSQVNPHFLYNTLDSIRWMALMRGEQEIAVQIEALSDVFRHSLNSGKKYTTLKQEVANLEAYMLIQKSRYGDSIAYHLQVQKGLENCRILKLFIQPLVENAILHGIEKKIGGGTIWVEIFEWEGKIKCSVRDDGAGVDEAEINQSIRGNSQRASFALKNIHERIQLEYGEAYGLRFFSSPEGTTVILLLPLIKDEV
jgi:two-component system sensor histidine kinase YesM